MDGVIRFLDEADKYDQQKCECSFCGWRGTWAQADKWHEGDFESGYYTVHVCPNGCEEEHEDISLYEVPDDTF